MVPTPLRILLAHCVEVHFATEHSRVLRSWKIWTGLLKPSEWNIHEHPKREKQRVISTLERSMVSSRSPISLQFRAMSLANLIKVAHQLQKIYGIQISLSTRLEREVHWAHQCCAPISALCLLFYTRPSTIRRTGLYIPGKTSLNSLQCWYHMEQLRWKPYRLWTWILCIKCAMLLTQKFLPITFHTMPAFCIKEVMWLGSV